MSDTESSGFPWLDRMDDHLGEIRDPVLLILKGHLLIEEALLNKLNNQVSEPKFVIESHLRYSQLVPLVRSFFPNGVPNMRPVDVDRLWDAISALNTIRNRLAHKLELDDMSVLLRRLFVIHPYNNEPITDPEIIGSIHGTLAFLLGFVSVLER